MNSAIKLRDLTAAKARTKASLGDSKGSTPSWKLKLQSRSNVTPSSTPLKLQPDVESTSDMAGPCDTLAFDTHPAGHDTQQPTTTGTQGEQKQLRPELKLQFVQQPPLLPKPELTRPEPPTDRAAVLRKLHDLRNAGSHLLEEVTSSESSANAADAVTSTAIIAVCGGTSGSSRGLRPAVRDRAAIPPGLPHPPPSLTAGGAASTPLHHQLQLQLHHRPGHLLSPAAPSPRGLTTPTRTPLTGGTLTLPSSRLLATTPDARVTGPSGACLSPSMLGLREQEHRDTGGGFLTHYADPRDIATPLTPPGTTGGGGGRRVGGLRGSRVGVTGGAGGTPGTTGGAAGGGSTPLSVLRTIHQLQRLQRLQREGSQLVEGIEAAAGEGAGQGWGGEQGRPAAGKGL